MHCYLNAGENGKDLLLRIALLCIVGIAPLLSP